MLNEALAFQIPDACKVSGLSRTALYEAFKRGAIIPRKNGSRTLVLARDLQRYLETLPAAGQSSVHRGKGRKAA
jgi:hypothetical protein